MGVASRRGAIVSSASRANRIIRLRHYPSHFFGDSPRSETMQAMNRDIVSVLLGGFGTKNTGGGETMAIEGEATLTNAKDVATALKEAGTASHILPSLTFIPENFSR